MGEIQGPWDPESHGEFMWFCYFGGMKLPLQPDGALPWLPLQQIFQSIHRTFLREPKHSTALHVLEVQDSVAWAKGSIFKNDSIERIGQSLDTAEKSKLTLPVGIYSSPLSASVVALLLDGWKHEMLKATMKDLTSFCRHSIWQYQLLNSQLLYGSIPACQATVKSGVHVFASLWP